MEKLEDKVAKNLFEDVDAQFEEVSVIEYGKSKLPVMVYKNISMADMNIIVEMVMKLAFDSETNDYNHVKREAAVATAVVRYLTNIPVAEIEDDNGEKVEDITSYYQIVFGDNGLYDKRKPCYWVINKIEQYVDKAIELKMMEISPSGRFFNRLIEIGKEISAIMEAAANDPELLNVLDNVVSTSEVNKKDNKN